MKKLALAAALVVTGTSFAQEGEVPPAPEALKPIPAQADGTVVSGPVVTEGQVVTDGQIITEGPVVQQQQPMVYSQQATTTYRRPVVRRSSRQGIFGRMMELERRKNAWLRRTFLNR